MPLLPLPSYILQNSQTGLFKNMKLHYSRLFIKILHDLPRHLNKIHDHVRQDLFWSHPCLLLSKSISFPYPLKPVLTRLSSRKSPCWVLDLPSKPISGPLHLPFSLSGKPMCTWSIPSCHATLDSNATSWEKTPLLTKLKCPHYSVTLWITFLYFMLFLDK